MSKNPLILDIKGNSLDDGPGIRSVVFVKGCPLSCSWCHNPESKKAVVEISFDPGKCVDCKTCLQTCQQKALSRNNSHFIDRKTCDLCFECVENCPSEALERVGKEISVPDLVKRVLKDKPFYDTSKGGVTFSGGEPTLRMDYLAEAARSLKENDIHVLVETCGHFDLETFIDKVYSHIDQIFFDIKLIDEEQHLKHCGISNRKLLDNFRNLYAKHLAGGIEVLPRIPLIPGITDTRENLNDIAAFLLANNVRKTQLMGYHPLWQEKNSKIGIPSPPNTNKELDDWMKPERVKECEQIFLEAGLEIAT